MLFYHVGARLLKSGAKGSLKVKVSGGGLLLAVVIRTRRVSFRARRPELPDCSSAKEAVRERVDDGCYHGTPPFGLRFADDKCHLEKDPDEFEQLEAILERREDGDRVVDVADDLDVSTATVSRVANRGIEWYQDKLAEYGLEDTNLPAQNPG